MKTIVILAAALVLAGCAGFPPGYVSSGNPAPMSYAAPPPVGVGTSPHIDPNDGLKK